MGRPWESHVTRTDDGLRNVKGHMTQAWAHHVTHGSERGKTGNSRGSRYIYCVLFLLVPFSPYVSIVIIDLTIKLCDCET